MKTFLARSPSAGFASFSTTSGERRAAAVIALLIVSAVAASVPFASLRGGPVPAYMPINLTVIAIVDLTTAFLLFRQCIASRVRSFAYLGGAYLWTGSIVIAYLVTFPDATGAYAFGAGAQSAIWLWVVWKLGFIAFLLVAVVDEIRTRGALMQRREIARYAAWLPAAIGSVVLLLAWYAIAHADALPPLIHARAYTPLFSSVFCPLIALGCVVAGGLFLIRSRGQNVAHLWLMITCLAVAAEVVLTAVGSTRYSIGFYAARTESLVAASVVLFALLHQSARLATTIASDERQARAIVENVADALLTVDEDGIIRDVNPAAYALFGVVPDARTALSAVIPDFAERRPSQAGIEAFEATGTRPDGTTFPIEVTVGAAGDALEEASERSAIIIARDITARKRAQSAMATARDQALETGRLKAQFLAMMSHEIRTPINGVIGMTDLLLGTELSGERRVSAQTVRDSAESLLDVVNNILDFSKIEAGKVVLESVAFAPGEAVEDVVELLAANARKKALHLRTFIDPSVPCAVLGDESRLRQVLLNLIGNAIKFTDVGSVSVRVAASGAELRIVIADTGIGIAAGKLERLFEPFSQADGSAKRRYGGSGLGLSISQKLIEMMGGSIAITSTPGSGSECTVSLPVEPLPDRSAPAQLPAGSRVLLRVADADERATLVAYLAAWGVTSTVALEADVDITIVDAPLASDGERLPSRLLLVDDPASGREAVASGYGGFVCRPLRRAELRGALHRVLTGTPIEAGRYTSTIDSSGKRLILLAEDHPVNQKITVHQLERLGYAVDVVATGSDAVAAAATDRYALVLMDCHMPGLDGFDAARAIRAREALLGGQVPIVALTANAIGEDRAKALAAGMDDYLVKPVQMSVLGATIERFYAPPVVS